MAELKKQIHPLDSVPPEFRQRVDAVNLFHLSHAEFGALLAAAPSVECAAFLQGVAETKRYFNSVYPQSDC